MANEVVERHKAEMQMLHQNQKEGEDLFYKKLADFKARRDSLLYSCPNIEQMNEAQRRNYNFINETIEVLEFFHRTQTAFGNKYKNLYDETIYMVKRDFVPQIKKDVILLLIDQFNESITDNFLKEVINNQHQ